MSKKADTPRKTALDDVITATKALAAKGKDPFGPDSPVMRWFLSGELPTLEREYQDGITVALLDVVLMCAMFDEKLPRWAAAEFERRYRRLMNHEASTLDEAFLDGPYLPSNAKISGYRQRRKKAAAVHFEIEKRHADGASLDTLFREVGAEYCISMSLARRYYYWWKLDDRRKRTKPLPP